MLPKSFWCSRIVAGWIYSALFSGLLAVFSPISAAVFALGCVFSLIVTTLECRADGLRHHRAEWWR